MAGCCNHGGVAGRITAGDYIAIDGGGSSTDPYVISAESMLRDTSFGTPQHLDLATFTYPTLLDFGPVNTPPPAATANPNRDIDLVAHWYNDFGLDRQALAAGQANGAYTWYDWSWNFPTNTGDGETTRGYDPQRQPLQGFYKGDDPEVLGWQAKWLAEAGINAVSIVQTDGFKRTAGGLDWSDPESASYWVYRLFNETPNFSALRWVAWLDSSGATADITAQIDEVVWAWETYPGGYTYTENGRTYAVLFLWDGELLRGAFDNYVGSTNTRAHLRSVADRFKTLGYDGVYVMARNAGEVATDYAELDLHKDGLLYGQASYNDTYAPPPADSYNNDFAQYAAKVVFPTPSVPNYRTIGVVTSAESVYPHPSSFNLADSTPAAFGLALRRAADHVVKNDMPRIITIGNVSEWAESGPGLIPNIVDGFGYLDQVRSLPAYTETAGATAPDVQIFTASGTWLKPKAAKTVQVTLVGGGGGGVSGSLQATGVASLGGAGGGGGAITTTTLPATSVPGSVTVTVGAAGAGGAAISADSTIGANGTSGGDTSFGAAGDGTGWSILKATGGARGLAQAGGAGGTGAITGMTGGNSSATGGAGTSVTATSASPGAGGGGGGVTSADAATAGGYGGLTNLLSGTAATATTTGADGVTRAVAAPDSGLPGGGGGGGGGGLAVDGGDGADGGRYGAGGGGGGASRNGFVSGRGGNGAPGIVVVVTHR